MKKKKQKRRAFKVSDSELERLKYLDEKWTAEGMPTIPRLASLVVEYQIGVQMKENFKNGGCAFAVKNGSYQEAFEQLNKMFPPTDFKFSDLEGKKGEINISISESKDYE